MALRPPEGSPGGLPGVIHSGYLREEADCTASFGRIPQNLLFCGEGVVEMDRKTLNHITGIFLTVTVLAIVVMLLGTLRRPTRISLP